MKELETLIANVSATVAVCAVDQSWHRLNVADAAKIKLIEYVERRVKEAHESGQQNSQRGDNKMSDDFGAYMMAQEKARTARQDWERAIARKEVADIRERCAKLVSQHEPVESLGVDREALKVIFGYVLGRPASELERFARGGKAVTDE